MRQILIVAAKEERDIPESRKGAYSHVNIYLRADSDSPFKSPGKKLTKTLYRVIALGREDGLWTIVKNYSADKRGGDPVVKMDRGPNRPTTIPPGTTAWKLQQTRWWNVDRNFGLRVTDIVEGPGAGLLACEFIGSIPDKFWYREGLASSLRLRKELREHVQKDTNRDCSKWN